MTSIEAKKRVTSASLINTNLLRVNSQTVSAKSEDVRTKLEQWSGTSLEGFVAEREEGRKDLCLDSAFYKTLGGGGGGSLTSRYRTKSKSKRGALRYK